MPGQTLRNKIAVISGSSSGIGAEIGRELASRGANIVLNYPSSKQREEADELVAGLPTNCIAVEADISTIDGPKKLVDAASKRFGKIDILINNAALAINKPFEDQTMDDWSSLVNLNGRGTFLLTQATLPYLPKEGAVFFTKVWAKELPPKYGVTVNAVSPGPTMTEGFAQAGEEFMMKVRPIIEKTPVANRLGKAEEIAFAVGFLCEPRASWINGTHI
ncbi:putative short chain dehydrogenase [Pyrenochaeta sp. MPI-SDFR-AT-0127]|nr:putative short chain dehydrogenase [Pyrenochaeta sp. MPI-SDFR-AT-0127]